MPVRLLAIALLLTCLPGCSLRRMAVATLADALAEGGSVYAADGDPGLVREALPFALKTFESLLLELPSDRRLLTATCSGFTQYAHAFVAVDAERLEFADYRSARAARERALALYLRARDYCLRGLDTLQPGIARALIGDPRVADSLDAREVDLIYWTAASWGSAIAAGLHRPDLVADLPAVRALFDRALEIDPDYGDGALHEAMIRIEALPEAMGGSRQRAAVHYRRAIELSGGSSASPHLTWATAVLIPAQEGDAFREALGAAIAVDVDAVETLRLANTIAKERAAFLLDHYDDFFLEPPPSDGGS